MSFNASQTIPDNNIHSLLIGPSGAGKTGAAMSFPGKTFVLDFDDRWKGPAYGCDFLQDKRKRGELEIETILPYTGKSENGLKKVYDVLEYIDGRVTSRDIVNVIVDGTTSMKRFFVNESMNNNLKTSGRGGQLAHFKIGEAILAGKPDHNYAATCMLNVIYQNLKTFRCNLFLSTHLKDKTIAAPTVEDPERVIVEGQTITAPGQLTIEIPGWFNEVWEFEVDTTNKAVPPRRFVIFQGKWARTSLGELGEEENGKWVRKHKLEITNRSLYEVLKPTFERMKQNG